MISSWKNNISAWILIVDNLNIIATWSRQTIYNNKGNLTITGLSYLSNRTERAPVKNVSSGTINIISGKIVKSTIV